MTRYFVPCTAEFLAEKIWQFMQKELQNDGCNKKDLEEVENKPFVDKVISFSGFNFEKLTTKIDKDLSKVEFDTENINCSVDKYSSDAEKAINGFHDINGLAFLGVRAGGDWEFPLYFIIYWDGKELRAYIPTDGNPWNTSTKSAYGNNDNDNENAQKRFGVEYEDIKEDHVAILNDIQEHIINTKTKETQKTALTDDMIAFIQECADIEGTELGEIWNQTIQLHSRRDMLDKKLFTALEIDLRETYQYLKDNTSFHEEEFPRTIKVKRLIFNDE